MLSTNSFWASTPFHVLLYIASSLSTLSSALPLPGITTFTELAAFNTSDCWTQKKAIPTPQSGAPNQDSDVSNTIFGVFSVLLAFGGLIVGIIGIMQYRHRKTLGKLLAPTENMQPEIAPIQIQAQNEVSELAASERENRRTKLETPLSNASMSEKISIRPTLSKLRTRSSQLLKGVEICARIPMT